ncbi:MAG: GNAT family N-acetyltransferase [Bacteroidetes bacterium]|nr:MAG: GNAT family N-acetyltransferase [Bacteroidota bacterium]
MVIKNKKVGNKGMFYVGDDGNIVAELVYSMAAPDKMVIEHTEVDESLKGKSVGLELVSTAVEYARSHQIKIVPLCPFAKSVIADRPGMQDVLYK